MKLVIQNTSHVWGGNEKSLAVLARGLLERGHEVVVSCAKGEVSERLRGMSVRVTHFRPRGQIDLISAGSFALWLRKENPHALLMTSWGSVPLAASAARWAGVKRIVLRQGIVRRAPSSGPRGYALRHWVDAVIANAPDIRDTWLQSMPGFPPERIHVVLNAVIATASRREEMRARLRSELQLSNDELIICAAGILSRRKNFELLFEAFASARLAKAVIVVVGDGAHRQSLNATVARLGIESKVRFAGAQPNASEYIGGSDIFVLSSRNEGMANVMLEAMAAGTPVIASDISGVRTAIGANQERPSAGWIFPADDAASLAATLTSVVSLIRSDPDAVSAITDEALWRIEHWFTRDRMVDQSEHILFG